VEVEELDTRSIFYYHKSRFLGDRHSGAARQQQRECTAKLTQASSRRYHVYVFPCGPYLI
jgi:hypothetical protein